MTKKAAKKKDAPRDASHSQAATSSTLTATPPRSHPWLLAISAAIFVIWLAFLTYVAWRATQ